MLRCALLILLTAVCTSAVCQPPSDADTLALPLPTHPSDADTLALPLPTHTSDADTLIVPRRLQSVHATLFGFGASNTYDTYLSPLEYSGIDIAFMHETFRMTHWRRISTQGIWRIYLSSTGNRAGNRSHYGGRVGYQHLWHRLWTPCKGLTLRAGGGVCGNMGFLYNTHLGNNPAQGYADVALCGSIGADYDFRLWRRTFSLNAQFDAPLLGMMFAPRYGQSYYNLFSQGCYDHNIVCSWLGNAPTLRGHVLLDIPVASYTLRVGYAFDIIQALPNNLRQHTYNHNLMIGWVKRFAIIKR